LKQLPRLNARSSGLHRTPGGTSVASKRRMPRLSTSESRARTERLQERTFTFAKRIVDLCPRRFADDPSRVLWRQLIRAAPSASGNLDEADEASSDDDFIYKMKVVLRETKESRRWLRFIAACALQNHQKLGDLGDEARQLSSIFATIVKNTESRVAREKKEARRQRGRHTTSGQGAIDNSK
jgi:four helix bundle protein